MSVGLYAEGMPLEEISVYMGHEDPDTTKGYIYNYNEIEMNRANMYKALYRLEYVKGCCTHHF